MRETADQQDKKGRTDSTLLTFLITDVRGYTRFTVEHGDEAAARLADRFAGLCEDVLGAHDGQVLELRGDEALAVFSSARNALRGAVALQQAFTQAAANDPSLPLTVGMGLDAGEPIPTRGGYRGGALNLAARLCSIAGAGEILASEGVVHLARKTEGLAFVDRGQVTLKGLAAPVRVLQIAAEGAIPEELPPLQPALVSHPTNLPDDPTPFIGREEEIASISARLRNPAIRLVTLTGPGGTGKTRLALQVGSALLYDFDDGVFLCDLSALADPALVPSVIAQVLSITEETGRELIETLKDRLKEKHLLLILDSLEHLLDASRVVADLLDACRELHILVTSRIPLHLSREQEHAVPPLEVPDARQASDAAGLLQCESVALFNQRATAAKDSFSLTDENATAVAEICGRLDGLPLAIELAAARIKLFPPQALLQRLSSRLVLLTGGARDRPARHQTLRRAIDWSYSLLSEEEQTLFARLSVFAGGWTFEAAETVCNGDQELDLLEGMASLVDKSLIRQEGEDEPRFSMLETIREYARERLDEREEGEMLRATHARYFLRFAVEADRHLLGPEQVIWLERLERDHDNLRAALRWAMDHADAGLALRLGVNLWRFWYWRGYFTEGRAVYAELLALRAGPELAAQRAELMEGFAVIPLRQGDYATARASLDEALVLAREAEDPRLLATTLGTLSFAARLQGDYGVARLAAEESVELARRVGDTTQTARSLHLLGLIALEADQDLEAAWTLNEQGLALYRDLGNRRMAGIVLGNLGRVARVRGDLAEARSLVLESVIVFRDLGDFGPMPQMLYTLAAVYADTGDTERAVRLQAAAEKMEERVATRVWPENRRERDAWLEAARDLMSDKVFARIWAEGQAMTVEEAVAYSLEESGSAARHHVP